MNQIRILSVGRSVGRRSIEPNASLSLARALSLALSSIVAREVCGRSTRDDVTPSVRAINGPNATATARARRFATRASCVQTGRFIRTLLSRVRRVYRFFLHLGSRIVPLCIFYDWSFVCTVCPN